MAVAYASIAAATDLAGDITITKPTGLAAGDLMVAFIAQHDTGTAASLTGWTSLGSQADAGNRVFTVLFRVADSADAAAADFTFTCAGNEKVGVLVRVTGSGFTDADNFQVSIPAFIAGDSTPTFTPGVSVISTSDLLIMCIADDTIGGISAYAVATNNPTWTERTDTQLDSTEDWQVGVATATPTASGATGDFSATATGTNAIFGALISITENTNQTVNAAVLSAAFTVQEPSLTSVPAAQTPAVISLVSSVQAPAVAAAAQDWNNQSKSSTTWTNASKS